MRVNLNVPFREKDRAYQLGARWDAARKTWYVENVENLEAFLRWIPERLKRPSQTRASAKPMQ
ncbi:DUF5710 domain-containing protein [Burkholderia multivorans]|uniref:DUF5710 domain-containing protein n=1 Tax=Burkholderia multivorans TaxID=87883 RepID=UPI001C22D4E4|nr:DUF5710 domain-containing protein [Burkholderia multivorans]MDN8078862.1 DUF5710 domain-containing protein [Burkholderia multivorans]